MIKNSQKPEKLLPKSMISLLIIGWFSITGIGVFSLNSLMNQNDLNSEKNAQNEQTVLEPAPELIISELPEDKEKSNLSFLSLIILLLVCSGGSLLVTHILKLLVTSTPEKKVVKKKKTVPVVAKKAPINQPSSPTILIIPPQTTIPLDRKNSSLAEMMDLRKKRSLVSIMHDN